MVDDPKRRHDESDPDRTGKSDRGDPGSNVEPEKGKEREELIEEAIIRGEIAGVEKRRVAPRWWPFKRRRLTRDELRRFPRSFGKLIDRYVFLEAFSMWLFGFIGFLSFLLVNLLFLWGEHLLNPNIPTLIVLKLVWLNVPFFITMALPVSIVFATLMSMGRLAKDNELTAMFTNGISLYRLFLPFFALAVINSVGMYYVNDRLVAPAFVAQDKLKEMYPALREEDELKPEKTPTIIRLPDGRYFTALELDKVSGQVFNVMIDSFKMEEIAGKEREKVVWIAKTAVIEGSVITLNRPKKYTIDADDQLLGMEEPPSATIDLKLDLKDMVSKIRTPEQLTREELKRQQRIKTELGKNTDRDQTDLWLKFSIPFAPIAFVLVAIPLSLRAPPRRKASRTRLLLHTRAGVLRNFLHRQDNGL